MSAWNIIGIVLAAIYCATAAVLIVAALRAPEADEDEDSFNFRRKSDEDNK